MKIINKNINNSLQLFPNYLKNLTKYNYKNILKKSNNLIKSEILLEIENSFILNINNNEIFFLPINKKKLNKNYIYTITKKYNLNIIITGNNFNYYLVRLYIYILLKKYNLNYIQGRILKRKKDKLLVLIYGYILPMNKKLLHSNYRLLYSRYKYKKLFYSYKCRLIFFKLIVFKMERNKYKINFSRKYYINDLKKQSYLKFIKKYNK